MKEFKLNITNGMNDVRVFPGQWNCIPSALWEQLEEGMEGMRRILCDQGSLPDHRALCGKPVILLAWLIIQDSLVLYLTVRKLYQD